MANNLKKYVQDFLLYPAATFNVDEDETNAQVVEDLISEERALNYTESRSKLRAQNASLLSAVDPRYKGKKVSRSTLKKDPDFDKSLSKYFEDENEEASDDDDDDGERKEEIRKQSKHSRESSDDDEDDHDNNDDDDDEDLDDSFMEEKDKNHISDEEDGFRIGGNSDFSKFAYDFEEDDADDDSNEEDEGSEEEDGEKKIKREIKTAIPTKPKVSIKKLNIGDEEEEIQKGQSIKSQLGLYDSLFEIRIGLQKGVGGSNQLPQFNTFKDFIRKKDPNYIANLSSAKQATRKLLDALLDVQKTLLDSNPETQSILTGKKNNSEGESDEEINSNEDDGEEGEGTTPKKGTKRKLSLEDYGEILSKRHAALTPYRNETLNRWYEKTKLLSRTRGNNKFDGFEVSALQQLESVLNNKTQLIRRTQLTGITRGTSYHVLGHMKTNSVEGDGENYDPEIFDDGDFYSRALEEMLKSKISLSDDMTEVSRKWIDIQKLRKKAKKKVDTRASKGRKLRYEVITKLQQYLAPSNPPHMDDSAINTLFASLFGKGINPLSKPANI